MSISKRSEVNRYQEDFSLFYHAIIDNFQNEAWCLGKAERSTYACGDTSDHTNCLKAHEIPFSSKAREIMLALHDKIEHLENAEKKKFSGSMDEALSMLIETLAACRSQSRLNNGPNHSMKVKVYERLNNFFESWGK